MGIATLIGIRSKAINWKKSQVNLIVKTTDNLSILSTEKGEEQIDFITPMELMKFLKKNKLTKQVINWG